jgi:hypothetical protein
MTKKSSCYPKCPDGCRAAHTLRHACFLLGVGRTTLYDLMNRKKIVFIETDYGRRILHLEIDRYLRIPANSSEQVRTELSA